MVRVLVGPTREQLEVARVNDAEDPHWIVSEHFRGFLTVRVKDYEPDAPSPAIERMRAAMAKEEQTAASRASSIRSAATTATTTASSGGAYESAQEEQDNEEKKDTSDGKTAAATAVDTQSDKTLDTSSSSTTTTATTAVDINDPKRIAWRKEVRRQHDAYFNKRRRMFVIQWAGQYLPTKPVGGGSKDEKTAWTADDIWFTQEADHSIPLPWGFNILLNVCRLIAPSFYSDHVEDPVRPWTGCRMVCHVNLMNASEPVLPSPPDRGPDQKSTSNDDNQHDNEEEQHPHYNETAIRDTIAKHWSTAGVVENEFTNDKKTKKSSMKAQLMMKSASESEEAVSKERGRRRRKYFSSATKRQEFVLAPEQVYGCEFFSEQLDAWRMQLKMGISLDVASTVGNQPLRFILRSRDDPETIFFVVQLEYYP